MRAITLLAPAKVNLFLRVSNKRKDGYHNIVTLFERISLADKLRIAKIPNGIIISSDKYITRKVKDNLVYKAAELILRYRGPGIGDRGPGEGRGVRITIEKLIPMAAGLGGGSSDAAATLLGINKLYNLNIEEAEMLRLAGKLGADVPFFVLNTPFALGRGKGEKLKRLKIKPILWHLIIYPGDLKTGTADIYKAFDSQPKDLAPRQSSGSSARLLTEEPRRLTKKICDAKIASFTAHSLDPDGIESMLYNDLQDTVIAKEAKVGKVIRRLASSLDKKAIVSGSGPGVFCLYRTRKEALEAKRRLFSSVPDAERRPWRVFIAKTLI
jgi:4-diphosphocytidyl-2-C-methyl-D-erythritol kinase